MTTIIRRLRRSRSAATARYMTGFMSSAAINGIEPGTETIGQSADPSSGILALGLAGSAIRTRNPTR